jgi:hypothetical protein
VAQYSRPDGTTSAGGWAYLVDSLHEDTDDVEHDSDSSYAEADDSDTTMILSMSSVTDPVVHTGHTLVIIGRAVNGSGGGEKVDIVFKDGDANTILTINNATLPDSYGDIGSAIDEADAANITNYGSFSIEITVDSLGGTENIRITQIYLETPDASATYYETLPATVTATALIGKNTGKPLASTVTATATLIKQGYVTLASTVTATALLVKKGFVTLASTCTGTAGLNAKQVIAKLLECTVTGTALLVRLPKKTLTCTVTGTVALLKKTSKTLASNVTGTALLIKQGYKTLASTVTATALLSRKGFATLASTVTATALMGRTYIPASVTGAARQFKHGYEVIRRLLRQR